MLEEFYNRAKYTLGTMRAKWTVVTHKREFQASFRHVNEIFGVVENVADVFDEIGAQRRAMVRNAMENLKTDQKPGDYCAMARLANDACAGLAEELRKADPGYNSPEFTALSAVLVNAFDTLERFPQPVRDMINQCRIFPTEHPDYKKETRALNEYVLSLVREVKRQIPDDEGPAPGN